jgi:hypothetical protein
MMARTPEPRIVGFDLGHAETALTVINDLHGNELNQLDLPCALGRRVVTVTAVAEHPDGILIGIPAVDEPGVWTRYVAFKSPELERESVTRPIGLFVGQMRRELQDHGLLPTSRPTRWVFGAPSGSAWDEGVLHRYEEILRAAGLDDVEVVRESRAAMLYARDSGEISIDASQLSGAVLVVDLGSSTTDFTAIVGLKVRPMDAGTHLGAGLIDKTIKGWILDRHPQRDELASWLEQNPVEEARLELACRWAKEDYFRNEAASHGGPRFRGGGHVYMPIEAEGSASYTIYVSPRDMAGILAHPFRVLGGKTWPDRLREDLEVAASGLAQRPDLVLLTGGASRMPFVMEMASELFGDDRVVMGAEPELAISRGLAIAGRTGFRASGFRKDMRRLFASDQIHTLVEDRLSDLASRLGDAVADGFVKRFALPAFRRWQSGDIQTLAGLETELSATVSAALSDPANEDILEVVAAWQNALLPDLAELTRPICDRWHIPRSALDLALISVSPREWQVSMGLSEIVADLAGNLAGWVAGLVVGIIVAALLAATSLATPVATAIVLVVGAGTAGGASEVAKEKIKEADIPLWARRWFTEARVMKNAPAKEQEISREITSKITQDGGTVVAQLSRRLETELKALADEAELMIS